MDGAQLSAREIDTNVISSVVTDRNGRFRFPYLKVGRYEVKVHKDGFADQVQNLTLTIGSAFELPISLSIASTKTSVTVSGEATVLETARTQIAGTVSQTEVRQLPLNGRNFLDLALLDSRSLAHQYRQQSAFRGDSAVPGQGISIGSQRNFSNSFIVDGLRPTTTPPDSAASFYGLESVQELQVVTSGGQAELGRALGGYVNVVTKAAPIPCTAISTATSATSASTRPTRCRTPSCP